MESFVAIMALVAAISIDRGIYFAMNAPTALTGGTVETAAVWVNSLGLTGVDIAPQELAGTAAMVGEQSIVSRTGGAPTLALGLSQILSQFLGGAALASFWYHFAIMFEALFILTAVDAGTRVARFMLQDAVGTFVPRFRDTSWRPGAWIGTIVMVGGWGGILIMGVTDPLGGINTLFPLFGIANQLLAAIALAVCLAIIARRGTVQYLWIVLVPLVAVAVITVTASLYKIFSPVPGVGYWAQHFAYRDAIAAGRTSMGAAKNPAQMEAVVRNTFVQGSLSIVFLVLTLVVLAAATIAAVRSVRSGGSPGKEDEAVPSRRYGPSGLIPTPSEKELEKQWLASAGAPTRGGGH